MTPMVEVSPRHTGGKGRERRKRQPAVSETVVTGERRKGGREVTPSGVDGHRHSLPWQLGQARHRGLDGKGFYQYFEVDTANCLYKKGKRTISR